MNKKAIIAMSGGVDSSVAAYLINKGDYDAIGVTLKLFANDDIQTQEGCCTSEDIKDAEAVAHRLGMEHFVFNFRDDFEKEVIARFIHAYENGATPNPCVDCNRHIKFKRLLQKAYEMDYDYVVTGHYSRVEKDGDRYLLKKGIDHTKDQSYVLYSLTQEQLSHTLLPLGSLTKEQVRQIAAEQGFLNARKKESQDICFVPDGDYAKFIEEYSGYKSVEGDYIDINGNVIGKHSGMIHYTVGQRKGLGVTFGKPMFVKSINAENNTVTLCEDKDLYTTELLADNLNFMSVDSIDGNMRVMAKTRYSQKEQPATLEVENGIAKVVFDNSQRAFTKGQSVVFYDGDTVIGGGKII